MRGRTIGPSRGIRASTPSSATSIFRGPWAGIRRPPSASPSSQWMREPAAPRRRLLLAAGVDARRPRFCAWPRARRAPPSAGAPAGFSELVAPGLGRGLARGARRYRGRAAVVQRDRRGLGRGSGGARRTHRAARVRRAAPAGRRSRGQRQRRRRTSRPRSGRRCVSRLRPDRARAGLRAARAPAHRIVEHPGLDCRPCDRTAPVAVRSGTSAACARSAPSACSSASQRAARRRDAAQRGRDRPRAPAPGSRIARASRSRSRRRRCAPRRARGPAWRRSRPPGPPSRSRRRREKSRSRNSAKRCASSIGSRAQR